MEMITCKEAALNWGVSERLVSGLCAAGKIPGAQKVGKSWKLPIDARKPEDKRIKSGKYRKLERKPVKLPLPVGISDYRKIQQDYYYVDKTLMIRDFLDRRPQVSLFTRPRRFGKTLNLDMLRTFFENTGEDTSCYFKNKKIWACGEWYTAWQGKYPAIFLSFKNVRFHTWEEGLGKIKNLLQAEYARHRELLDSPAVADYEKQYFHKILDNTATEAEAGTALAGLMQMLDEHYKQAPMIFIDEYDTPVREGNFGGCGRQTVRFLRNFFSAAFKDASHLAYAFLTGELNAAREDIFGGLNNLTVSSVVDEEYDEYFGFTINEVKELTAYYGIAEQFDEIWQWYGGYHFGKRDLFNPWSVLNYTSKNGAAQAYWSDPADSVLFDEILEKSTPGIMEKLQAMLQGENVLASVDMETDAPLAGGDPSCIFSYLLVTGFLKIVSGSVQGSGYVCEVAVPNKEMNTVYCTEIIRHFRKTGALSRAAAAEIAEALYAQDHNQLLAAYAQYLDGALRHLDAGKETFLNSIIIGSIALLNHKYKALFSRSSGDGKFEIGMEPQDSALPGIILEMRYESGKTERQLDQLAKDVLKQANNRRYEIELKKTGVKSIVKYGIAFSENHAKIILMLDERIRG